MNQLYQVTVQLRYSW